MYDDPRRTYRWQVLVRQVLAESDVCVICGHPGANEGGHIIPVRERPDLALDRDNVAPEHGAARYDRAKRRWRRYCCPTCGRTCNQSKGARVEQASGQLGSRDW